jgi:uncharacterized protein YecT (DUF1311 family)
MISLALVAAMLGNVQPAQPDIDCAEARTQMEMNLCAGEEYRRADAELNRVWPQALGRARALDKDSGRREAENRLRAAQRAWIAYRDAQCDVAGLDALGGSLEPMLIESCRTDLTRRRTNELALLLIER